MPLNFPDSPTPGTVFTSGATWIWDGVKWSATGTSADLGDPVAILHGGTAATTAAQARTNLGVAALASPVFTGDPQGPTPVTADNDNSLATTAFVKAQGYTTPAALASYVAKAGDSMSGPLTVNAGGAAAVNIPGGGLSAVAATLGAGASTIAGTLAINGAGTALNVSTGNVAVGGTTTLASTLTVTPTGTAINVTAGSIACPSGQVSANSLSIAAGGFIAGSLTINGTSTALNVPNGNISSGGQLSGGTLVTSSAATIGGTLTINGGGTALNVPLGSISTAGAITAASLTASSTVTVNGSGNSFSVPNGNINAGGSITAVGHCIADGYFIGPFSGYPILYDPNGLRISFHTTGALTYPLYNSALSSYYYAPAYNAQNLQIVNGGGASPTGWQLNLIDNSANVYGIYVDALSDERLKENIQDTQVDALAKILAIPVRSFQWTAEYMGHCATTNPDLTAQQQADLRAAAVPLPVAIGIVAQEVGAVIPEGAQTLGVGPLQPQGSPIPNDGLYIDHRAFSAYLIKAIQQINTLINGPKKGVTDGSDAAPGYIGELLTAAVQPGSSISAVSNVVLNVTTLALTPGDWDLQGQVATQAASGGHIQNMMMWMSPVSATVPSTFVGGLHEVGGFSTGGTEQIVLPSGRMRMSVAVATTVYLSTKIQFTGSLKVYGFVSARRVR